MDENPPPLAPPDPAEAIRMLAGLSAGALVGFLLGVFFQKPLPADWARELEFWHRLSQALGGAAAGGLFGFEFAGLVTELKVPQLRSTISNSAPPLPWWSVRGRISRSSYWGRFFVLVAAGCAIGLVGPILQLILSATHGGELRGSTEVACALVNAPATLFGGCLMIAVTFRRLHDLGRPGWIAVGLNVVTWVFSFGGTVILAVLAALQIVFFVTLGCLPGKPGANQFGEWEQ